MGRLLKGYFPLGRGRDLAGRVPNYQGISDGLVYNSIAGRADIIIKSWSGDMDLSISNSVSGLLSCF